MRICMISAEYPPKWGGVGVVTYYLSKWMAMKGHEVHVVTRKQPIGYVESHRNIHIHPVKWLKLPMLFATSFGKNAVDWVTESGIDFDIVHVHSNMALIKRKHYDMIKPPIVSTMYGTWVGERSSISLKNLTFSISALNDLAILFVSPFMDKYEDLALERSNGVIVISMSECRALALRKLNGPCRRRILIPPGIDTGEFRPENRDLAILKGFGIKSGDRLIVSVGRWAARKGVRETVMAFELMLDKRDDLSLALVGWGPLEREIRKRIKRRGLEEKLFLLKSLSFKEMQVLVATADLAMFHSYWEGFGLTFGEAMASGTPVVVTDVGGAPDMVVEGTGKLVKVGDVEGQAKAALELLERSDLDEWGRRGRGHIDSFCSWRTVADRTEALYRWVLEDPEDKKGLDFGLERCPGRY